ncbi:metal ABC transporter substrate-binding protein [Nocardioides currus]|uniref:Zinc ABC transporter substrate-binding protein n=1 Tax=Nocardioides currus TaxID=2133958 RepID=A0A2R7YVP5_9ACTN|nr:metal ABC transporter substrate-binding protein [Nocardioides currus]PUA80448.1 zinc ABC transporter substrate-binding protein [Nocardioides currus]
MFIRTVAALAIAPLLLTGCGGSSDASGAEHEAAAAFFPLQWVTEQVGGDAWEVTGLTAPGAEPHDLELGIAETAALDRADVVVFEHDFQPAVDEAVANVATGITVDAADDVHLRDAEEHDHEETDGTGHTEESEEGHDHGDHDPHFWQDPLLMADLADAVAEALTESDPEGADTYAANAADLRERLEGLDAAYTDGLASCERTTMVVTHEAFGYLERYGLHFESIVGLSPEAEPTPAVIARLQDLIAEDGITTVFSERLASTAMADALASDTGVTTAVLDPIEGPAEGEDGSDYVSLMEQNLAALQQAGGC